MFEFQVTHSTLKEATYFINELNFFLDQGHSTCEIILVIFPFKSTQEITYFQYIKLDKHSKILTYLTSHGVVTIPFTNFPIFPILNWGLRDNFIFKSFLNVEFLFLQFHC